MTEIELLREENEHLRAAYEGLLFQYTEDKKRAKEQYFACPKAGTFSGVSDSNRSHTPLTARSKLTVLVCPCGLPLFPL